MRWNTESWRGEKERKAKWHPWFDWHPVVIKTNGIDHWVWLEPISRKGECKYDGWNYEYAEIGEETE